MINTLIAFDKSSVRSNDVDGRLHVSKTNISKSCVSPYLGREIPRAKELGLDENKVYKIYRDAGELEKSAGTFANLSLLMAHPKDGSPVTPEDIKEGQIVGTIGSNVTYENPYLCADIAIWDATAIAGIESEQVKELSASYYFDLDLMPGEIDGEKYDFRMINIRGNHLALVENGRAGHDVLVADSKPCMKKQYTKTNQEKPSMKMTKLGNALFKSLSAASPVLAADSALPALVGSADRKTFNAKQLTKKLIAMDADLDPDKTDDLVESIAESADPESKEPAKDESPSEKIASMLNGKVDQDVIDAICAMLSPAMDDAESEDDSDEKVKSAMDSFSKELREKMKDENEAREDVRAVVGAVFGMDSAAEIYSFALDHLNVNHDDVKELPALKALFKVASNKIQEPVKVASDSKDALKLFPGLARFSQR